MCITETWHQPDTFSSLNESCPPGYRYLQKARSTGRGGGLAVIYRCELELSLQLLPELSSFECLAFKSKHLSSVLFLLIYRPPKPNSSFILEISNLLATFCSSSADVIILGDMNIHVDIPSCRSATEFLQLLDCLNLKQLVVAPTHIRGHTLDLVITNSAPLKNLQVYDLGVSDHKVVSMELLSSVNPSKPKRYICFRNLKKINPAHLAADLQHLSTHFSSPDEAVEYYNSHLRSLLDHHAPIKSRAVTFTRSAPWFTDGLRRMKTAGRALERRYKTSGLTVDRQIYRDHQNKYSKALKEARSKFFSNTIRNSPGNSKQLFSTVNHLLKLQTPSPIGSSAEQCNLFMDFFTTKISLIRSALPGPLTQTAPLSFAFSQPLSCFPMVSSEEVQNIIKNMKSTTCALDPLPTSLCGKFVVLVDLHILPQGCQNGSTWFLQEHKEEVGALTKDAVEQRVRQFRETRQGQSKQMKELSPDNPMCIKGQTLRLAAYFLKRHVNLRCVIRQHYRELRVFPERFIVCVSLPENDMAPFGNLKMAEQSGQSRSGYFSGPRETIDPLNSSTITKRAALQKIARQADAHLKPEHKIQDQNQLPRDAEHFVLQEKGTDDEVMDVSMQTASEGDKTGCSDHSEQVKQNLEAEDCAKQHDMDHDSGSNPQDHQTTGRRRRRIPSSHMEDFNHHEAKRACVRERFIGTETRSCSTMALVQSSTLGPSPSHPGAAAQASSEGMLEEELLTHGKQAPRLPLSNNNAKHTNQSRLAASLRGLSVRAVSSSSSISSRSAAKEEKPSVPRISRLRRLKKS
ncbi:hypothetical protein MHYP_G00246280 [Metynnis hypsauchen]